jgi:hypothetical protein
MPVESYYPSQYTLSVDSRKELITCALKCVCQAGLGRSNYLTLSMNGLQFRIRVLFLAGVGI